MARRALMLLVLLASTAHADNWDADLAFGGSFQWIGGTYYSGPLVQIQVGRRVLPRLALTATGELAGAFDSRDVKGGVMRGFGGLEIYVVGAAGREFYPNVLALIGTGTETVAWDRGTLTRSTSYLGLEYRYGFSLSHSDFFRAIDSMSWRFGIRAQFAPGVEHDTIAKLCTACEATPAPRGIDAGFAFYMGLVFGR